MLPRTEKWKFGESVFSPFLDNMLDHILKDHDVVEENYCFEISSWIWIFIPLLSTWGKSLNLSRAHFPHQWTGNANIETLLIIKLWVNPFVGKSEMIKLAVPNDFLRIGAWISFSNFLLRLVFLFIHISCLVCLAKRIMFGKYEILNIYFWMSEWHLFPKSSFLVSTGSLWRQIIALFGDPCFLGCFLLDNHSDHLTPCMI